MEQELIKLLSKFDIIYEYITPDLHGKILELFKDNKVDKNINDGDYLNYLGLYYEKIKNNEEAEIAYIKAITQNSKFAIDNLLNLYDITKNINKLIPLALKAFKECKLEGLTYIGRYFARTVGSARNIVPRNFLVIIFKLPNLFII